MTDDLKLIHDALLRFEKRAERANEGKLTETFVDAAPLVASILTPDNQVIFGRRGTGKTHLLKYIVDRARQNGEIAIYLDLRSLGSNGSIYSDGQLDHRRRATPLLLDVLQALHEQLVECAIEMADLDLSVLGPELDGLASSISQVEVAGEVQISSEDREKTQSYASLKLNAGKSGIQVATDDRAGEESESKLSVRREGVETYYVKFGDVQSRLTKVAELLHRRIWLLLDEWSEIPLDLQPYLADLLRRCVVPLSKVTVKIAAIEHRSRFIIRKPKEYTGLELGADVGADVNLDDFMVFDNDAERSRDFFSSLLYRHFLAQYEGSEPPENASAFVKRVFSQSNAFEEFLMAVEGVPRDAIYLCAKLARKSYGGKFGIPDIRTTARDWYLQDKSTVMRSYSELSDFLKWIVDEVIGHRRARAFLVKSDIEHELLETLFDSRLIHIRKRGLSSNAEAGERYDAYKLDYGCYVDLMATNRAPQGLFPEGDDGTAFVEVPPDDYRSIRRAILDMAEFEKARGSRR